jgi:hypothetical protein
MVACIAAATAVLSVTGCNQPAVSLKPPAFQSSENTVRDWNDVAHKIAASMVSIGLLPDPTRPPRITATPAKELPFGFRTDTWQPEQPNTFGPRPIFIRSQAPDSAFVQQVAKELDAEILRRGAPVARIPDGATVVNLDVNFVKWGPRDKPPGLAGTTAAIATIPGLVIGASVPMSLWTATDAAGATAGGFGILSDLIVAITPTMNAEAIWEATVVTDDRVVMQLQEPIYIRGPDIPLYAKTTSLSPMSSWGGHTTPLVARQIRY